MKNLDLRTFLSTEVKAAVAVKATSGVIQYLHAVNGDAAVRYIQVFNVPAASVVLGTTVPVLVLTLAASTYNTFSFPAAVALGGSGISVAATTTADGAVTSTADCVVNALYA
jgi:hypothetical protein